MNKEYRIKYVIHLEGVTSLKGKEIKIKNCMSSLHAQIRLEEFLKKKYINFKQLEVNECKEENNFNDIFSQFGDIFGTNNFSQMFGGK